MKKEQEVSSLELVLSAESIKKADGQSTDPYGLVIGTISGFGNSGEPLVTYAGAASDSPVSALSIVALDSDAVGRRVALQFEEGDRRRPVILGIIRSSIDAIKLPS